MQNTLENRKITLQNLLHKSEMFNQYLQNQQTLHTIISLNQSRKHQILQFGKCQINLPQKVKLLPEPRFNCNKLMVLTKSKKQAQKVKQKYDYLQKIKDSQVVDLSPQRKSVHQNPMSAKIIQSQNLESNNSRLLTPQRSQTPQQKVCMSNPQFNQQISLQLGYILQKQKQNRLFSKNRSSSAKVRPKVDLLNKQDNLFRQRKQSFQARRSVDNNQIQVQKIENKKVQVSFGLIAKQIHDDNNQKTQQQQKSDSKRYQFSNKQQLAIEVDNLKTPLSYSSYYQKRPTSFSLRKQYLQSQTPSLLVNKNFQQSQQQQKKNQIIFRKQLHKTYKRAFVPPPKISAKAYAIYQFKKQGFKQTGKIIHAFNGKMAQQVASLTKIMTCLIILQLAEKYNYDLNEEFVQIGKFQSSISGTSAEIKCGQIYSVQQLLYGLMLPSGNDASLALGVWGGKVLCQSQLKCHTSRTQDNSQTSSPLYGQKKFTKKDYIQRFVDQMNEKAKNLQMTRTHYANTHGLVNPQNKSSAIDITLLCEYAMSNQKFAKIVSTRTYVSQIKLNRKIIRSQCNIEPSVFGTRQISWQNTHMLLQRRPSEYIGIKTGVTTAAGPCLASCIYNKQKDRKFIIVVLGCKSMGMRFKQTQVLKRWLFKQENIPIKWKKVTSRKKGCSSRDDKSQIHSQIQEGEQSLDQEDMSCEDNCED